VPSEDSDVHSDVEGGGVSVGTGSEGGISSAAGAIVAGAGFGIAFFLGFAFFTMRFAFFFAPFLGLPFFGKHSHRRIVEVELVIKLA
jgi:hypothetical protein